MINIPCPCDLSCLVLIFPVLKRWSGKDRFCLSRLIVVNTKFSSLKIKILKVLHKCNLYWLNNKYNSLFLILLVFYKRVIPLFYFLVILTSWLEHEMSRMSLKPMTLSLLEICCSSSSLKILQIWRLLGWSCLWLLEAWSVELQ